jgi:hypothetical protein
MEVFREIWREVVEEAQELEREVVQLEQEVVEVVGRYWFWVRLVLGLILVFLVIVALCWLQLQVRALCQPIVPIRKPIRRKDNYEIEVTTARNSNRISGAKSTCKQERRPLQQV